MPHIACERWKSHSKRTSRPEDQELLDQKTHTVRDESMEAVIPAVIFSATFRPQGEPDTSFFAPCFVAPCSKNV